MKTTAYCTLVALSINMLILPPASAAQQRHTQVYIEQHVTVTTTTHRATKDIVRDLGILCEALLEKPSMYHPQHIFEIFVQLIDEYMMVSRQHTSLAPFRNTLAELKQEIETKKANANATKILTILKNKWPQDPNLVIFPAHIDMKLQALQKDMRACLVLCKSLQDALRNSLQSYQHKSAQEVSKALFKR